MCPARVGFYLDTFFNPVWMSIPSIFSVALRHTQRNFTRIRLGVATNSLLPPVTNGDRKERGSEFGKRPAQGHVEIEGVQIDSMRRNVHTKRQ